MTSQDEATLFLMLTLFATGMGLFAWSQIQERIWRRDSQRSMKPLDAGTTRGPTPTLRNSLPPRTTRDDEFT